MPKIFENFIALHKKGIKKFLLILIIHLNCIIMTNQVNFITFMLYNYTTFNTFAYEKDNCL